MTTAEINARRAANEFVNAPADYTIKVTRRVLLCEQRNDMCHNYYYLIHVRIYNADKSRYRKARFVVWFNNEDVCEYVDCDYYTAKDVEKMLDAQICCFCDAIQGYNDTKSFYELCEESINHYNRLTV